MTPTATLLLEIIRAIVAYPDEVELYSEISTDEKGELTTIHVKVHNTDIGLCIGKGGETAEAVRKVINLAGHRLEDKRYYTKIDAPKLGRNHFTYDTSREPQP